LEVSVRPQASLVDLLDRVLDRGLVIRADIIISLAGVPLVGINLTAAVAGIETMIRYGMFEAGQTLMLQEEGGRPSIVSVGWPANSPEATKGAR